MTQAERRQKNEETEAVFRRYWERLQADPYFRHCQEYSMWIEDDHWCWEYRLIHGEPE